MACGVRYRLAELAGVMDDELEALLANVPMNRI
jgi:hypothetical protein